jgi:hypothetical protein
VLCKSLTWDTFWEWSQPEKETAEVGNAQGAGSACQKWGKRAANGQGSCRECEGAKNRARAHGICAVEGVKEWIAVARPVYQLLDAVEKLAANYPDCDHNFPLEVREVAYAWLDRSLRLC